MNIIPIDYALHLNDMLELFSESLKNTRGKAWFEWKHIRNPFGKSVGYIAEEDGVMLGVRLFMRWQIRCNDTVLKALRPVDTVTRPEARGRGIFTALTRRAIEDYRAQYDLIFNTPNHNSLPGYLKMGWTLPAQQFRHFYIFTAPFQKTIDVQLCNQFDQSWHIGFENVSGVCHTVKTQEFFSWRYEGDRYLFSRYQDNVMVFEKIKKKGLSVVVVKDFAGNSRDFERLAHATAKKLNAPLILCTNNFEFGFTKPFASLPGGRSVVAFRGYNRFNDVRWSFTCC
jgi:hypothetical protein